MKFPIYFYLILTFDQLQKNVSTCPFRQVAKIIHSELYFFFYLGFLSRTFTIHMAAGEGAGYLFNSSLPFPPVSQTLRHFFFFLTLFILGLKIYTIINLKNVEK